MSKTADIYFDLVDQFSNEIEKEAQGRYPVNDSTKDLYIPSNAAFQHGAKYGLHLAALRSKELQERVETQNELLRRSYTYISAYPLSEDSGELMSKIDSALSGEATKEKDESLEAYNRECKRVDDLESDKSLLSERLDKQSLKIAELTEWKDEAERKLIEAGKCMGLQSERIQELEGLLKEITASFDANDDYRFTNVKIKRMLNLL